MNQKIHMTNAVIRVRIAYSFYVVYILCHLLSKLTKKYFITKEDLWNTKLYSKYHY
jgi:hypothetical protein